MELFLYDELQNTVNRLLKNQTDQIERYKDLHFLDKISDGLFSLITKQINLQLKLIITCS